MTARASELIVFTKTYQATHPDMMADARNEQLRERYLVTDLFAPDRIALCYSHNERFVIGGAAPVNAAVELPAQTEPQAGVPGATLGTGGGFRGDPGGEEVARQAHGDGGPGHEGDPWCGHTVGPPVTADRYVVNA